MVEIAKNGLATGTLELQGVDGVTVIGTARVEFNDTGVAIDQTITVVTGTGTDNVRVLFADGSIRNSFATTSLTVDVAGQRFVGAASFVSTTIGTDTFVDVTFTDVDLRLGGGLVVVNDADGTFRFGPHGVTIPTTVTVGGSPAISLNGIPGVSLVVGSASVAVDTTGTSPSVGVSVTGATLTLAGISLTNVSFTLVAIDGGVAISISSASLTFAAGTASAAVSAISGKLLVDASGVAGRLNATVAVTATGLVAFSGTWNVVVSTRSTAFNGSFAVGTVEVDLDLPAGPFLRLEATNAHLDVTGASLSADVVVERVGGVLAVGVSKASISLASGLVTVTNGSGLFVLNGSSVFGRATGTLTETIAGVDLSGTASVAFNTAATDQTAALTVGGQLLSVSVPKSFVGVGISGAVLQVAGLRVTIDQLDIGDTAGVLNASGVGLGFEVSANGRRVIGLSGARFALRIQGGGSAGFALAVRGGTLLNSQLGGDLTLDASNLSLDINTFTSSVALEVPNATPPPATSTVNLTAAANATTPFVSVSAGPVTIHVLGATASAATLSFKIDGSAVDVTGTTVSLSFGTGGLIVVGVTSSSIALRVTDAGIAFVIAGATLITPTISGVTIGGPNMTATLRVNTTSATQRLVAGGITHVLTAAAPGAAYVRVEVVNAVLGLPGLSFAADKLVFERLGSTVTLDGTDVSVELAAGSTRIVKVSGADLGARFAPGTGANPPVVTAAVLGATVEGPSAGYGITFSAGSASAVLNTATSAVTIDVGGTPVVVAAAPASGSYARIELLDAMLNVGGGLASIAVAKLVIVKSGTDVTASADDIDITLAAGASASSASKARMRRCTSLPPAPPV